MTGLRRLAALAALVALASTAAAHGQRVYAVDREQVNVRDDATARGQLVGVLNQGEQVVELRRREPWFEVRLPDGRTGWVHGQLLQPRLLVLGQGVRVRQEPTTQGRSVTMLYRGQEVGRLRERSGWTEVRLADGRIGWLSSRYVRAKTEADLRQEQPPPAEEPPPVGAGEEVAVDQEAVEAEPAAEPQATAADESVIPKRSPYAEGLQHEAGGDAHEALRRFEEVLAQDPTHLNALVHAAQAHRNLGQYEEALEKLYRALELGGARKDVYLTLGEVYRLRAEADSAAKYQALFRGEEAPAPARLEAEATAPAAPAPTAVDEEFEDLPEEGVGLLRGPWVLVGLAGIGLLALAGIVWWIASGSSGPGRAAPAAEGGAFGKLWNEEAAAVRQGRATPEEEVELDRRIDDRWRELRASTEAFSGSGGEADGVGRVLDQMESLRRLLDGQDERARLYADIVRLQNMKIEAMAEEIRRLRARGKV